MKNSNESQIFLTFFQKLLNFLALCSDYHFSMSHTQKKITEWSVAATVDLLQLKTEAGGERCLCDSQKADEN